MRAAFAHRYHGDGVWVHGVDWRQSGRRTLSAFRCERVAHRGLVWLDVARQHRRRRLPAAQRTETFERYRLELRREFPTERMPPAPRRGLEAGQLFGPLPPRNECVAGERDVRRLGIGKEQSTPPRILRTRGEDRERCLGQRRFVLELNLVRLRAPPNARLLEIDIGPPKRPNG